MNQRGLDEMELGQRVTLHLITENELHRTTRIQAIAYRASVK